MSQHDANTERTYFALPDTDAEPDAPDLTEEAIEEIVNELEPTMTSLLGRDDENERPISREIPDTLPVLAVKDTVVFPGTIVPLTVGREKSKQLVEAVYGGSKILGIAAQRMSNVEDPSLEDLYRVGTVVTILKRLDLQDGNQSIIVHGLTRFGIEEMVQTDPYLVAKAHTREDQYEETTEIDALVETARRLARRVIELTPGVPEEAPTIMENIEKPGALADFLAANLSMDLVNKQEILETFDIGSRLRKINRALATQLEILELSNKIHNQVKSEIDKTQREYYLHEQLQAIQKELGITDGRDNEAERLREAIAEAKMPEPVEKEALRELERLQRTPQGSPDYSGIIDYLEWMCELPWSKSTRDKLDIDRAREILDEDHYGLDKIKRRILEFLAVRKLNPKGKGTILCFSGPPGVGKTSLGRSIARALGRNFIRMSVGGVRDEADIRGHRRTYIGSIPGRVIQEIRKAGSNNPVLMLDEVDKIGSDFRGDPASALLEVLDPAQNNSFQDHYLGVPFDLSNVMFICTANYMDRVPHALRDRMEVIELAGYTLHDKSYIAKRYLIPRRIEASGLKKQNIKFTDDAIERIIESYTSEAGVRNLEREIGSVCRALAAQVAEKKKIKKTVTPEIVEEILGPIKYEPELALRTSSPGVVTGLAWTPFGGEILFVEASAMPGRGNIQLTGQLGDVMRESAMAALSVVRSRAADFGVDAKKLTERDVHIHVPAGAIPKDGPSAGVAMFTAIVSLFTGRACRSDVGMTGEITLRGLVLPIGGLKEKALAAHRAGIKTVVIPARNERHLVEVPEEIRDKIKFVPVQRVEEVLAAALEKTAKLVSSPYKKKTKSQKKKKTRKTKSKRRKTSKTR